MIKFENVEIMGWEHAIRGMRNPMNSWEKSDSGICKGGDNGIGCENCAAMPCGHSYDNSFKIGKADHELMMRLTTGGPTHSKYRRMITVYMDITAPLYWWKEFDTYKVGTVANSCSTMHKIHAKEFTLEDFSCDRLINSMCMEIQEQHIRISPMQALLTTIECLNSYRELYLKTKDKKYWWQMIQLLPSSYNQKRTVMLNYEVLAHIYQDRRNHKLDEWAEHKTEIPSELVKACNDSLIDVGEGGNSMFGFCDWIKTLPYSELITGERI